MRLAIQVERLAQPLVQRLGIGDLLEQLHPLLVLDAFDLHRGDGLALGLVGLRHQNREGIVEDRLDHTEDVERIALGFLPQQLQRLQREGRQRLIQREVLLQVDRQRERAALRVGLGQPGQHAGGHEF
jgi:hypothetical protein